VIDLEENVEEFIGTGISATLDLAGETSCGGFSVSY
jgi:hypothetical protein